MVHAFFFERGKKCIAQEYDISYNVYLKGKNFIEFLLHFFFTNPRIYKLQSQQTKNKTGT